MTAKQHFQARRCTWSCVAVCALTTLLGAGSLLGDQDGKSLDLTRYRVFSLRQISADQGKKYLTDAGTGTVSQLPGARALLVTGRPRELLAASAILKLVDGREHFVVRAIRPGPQLPPNDLIAAELPNMSIGTFSEPPARDAQLKAIIDVHEGTLIVVAPVGYIEKISSAIQSLEAGKTPRPAEVDSPGQAPRQLPAPTEAQIKADALKLPKQPTEQAEDADEFFGKLLNSLDRAEKRAVEQDRKPAPSQPPLPPTPTPRPSADQVPAEQLDKPAETPGPAEDTEAEQPAEPPPAEPAPQFRLYEPEPVEIADEMLELDLPEKLNIIDLVDLVGKYLNLDYMYDPAKIKGDVALKLQGPMKIRDLYPLLESVLKFRGFVMARKGNLVTIVPTADALNIDPALLDDEAGTVRYGDVVITRVFTLQYIDTASAQNLLKGMKLGAAMTPVAEAATLIITDYAHRMARIEDLLSIIDKPGRPKHFRFRQLRYTMAKALAPKIKELSQELGTVSISIAAPPAAAKPTTARDRRRARPARRPTPAAPAAKKPTVYLDADERTNRILMIGYEEQLAVVEELIDALDVAQQDLRTLRIYEIQHVGAEEVKAKLEELDIIGASRTPRPATTRARPARAARAAGKPATPAATAKPPAAGATEALVEEPQVVIIDSTNSLLVNASAEQHTRIAVIISYVDSETLELAIPYVVYSLENQSPEDLAAVLTKLIQETVKDKEGKIERVIKKQEDIVIVPDESTFSIIVYASKKNQEWIRKLIKNLDKRRPQVLIDVSLVEITRDEDFEYDLSLITNAAGSPRNNLVIKGGTLPIEIGARTVLEAGFNLLDTDGKNTKRVRGFYSDDRIQVLLNAIDSKGYGRILAKPKILVNDNEEGVIKTTEKTFVGEETQSWPGEGQTPVTTTKWTPYEAKIELTITPHISEGNLLRLEVNMTREDFEKQELAPPDYATSNINTIVTVPDGSTIILGGLTKLKQAKAGSKVPLLGDIPLIGALFRSVDNSNSERKLYIFVKATILRPDDVAEGLGQLQQISAKSRAAFEVAETAFQKYQSFPGMQPDPMDPLRVLDTE